MTAAVVVLAVAAASAIAALVWMAAKHYASVNDYYAQLRSNATQREQIAALTGERNTYLVRATKAEYEFALMTERFNDSSATLLAARKDAAHVQSALARGASNYELGPLLDRMLGSTLGASPAVPDSTATDREGDDLTPTVPLARAPRPDSPGTATD